jgi:hypothetical protein
MIRTRGIEDLKMLNKQKLFTTTKTQKKDSIMDLLYITKDTPLSAFVAGTLIVRTNEYM